MNRTTNLGLTQYELSDKFNITGESDSLNKDMQIIDEHIHTAEVGLAKVEPNNEGTTDQILRKSSSGSAYWSDPATQSEIGQAVTDWLDENVPQGETLVVDPTLSISQAAADAKVTGDELSDLKSAIDMSIDITYVETLLDLTYASGKYWNSEGNTAVKKNNSAFGWAECNVTPGEIFKIIASQGNTHKARIWVTTDGSYNIVSKDQDCYTTTAEKKERFVVIPSGATKLLITYLLNGVESPEVVTYKLEDRGFAFRGFLDKLGYTSLMSCLSPGWYGCASSYTGNITDLPTDFPTDEAVHLVVYSPGAGNEKLCRQEISTSAGDSWNRVVRKDTETIIIGWTKKVFRDHGNVNELGFTSLLSCTDYGWYGIKSNYVSSITDLPMGYSGAGTLFNYPKSYNQENYFTTQVLQNIDFGIWNRVLLNGVVYKDWEKQCGRIFSLAGKKVAIIGDSISTNGNSGTNPNVPEITITSEDVGVSLNAWLTYYDVKAGLTLGGHAFTSSEIGTKVTFTPTAEDVGKSIGLPNNYNPNSTTVWWEIMMAEFGFVPIPVCWSGSSMTSHEGDEEIYKTSYAWHEAQIRKCGIRTPGSMSRTSPDIIIIYRGTNDFSHAPYTLLTDDYFDNFNWQYPDTDVIADGYGYKEGICLTIKKLRDAYPNAKIFLCTLNVFKRINYSHFPTNNGIDSLPQYNNAIREVANFMGCGLIEFDKDGITFENCYSQGYITDSSSTPTHPSDKGHKVMGLKAIADIDAQYSQMN